MEYIFSALIIFLLKIQYIDIDNVCIRYESF